jgi:hypothetical protein
MTIFNKERLNFDETTQEWQIYQVEMCPKTKQRHIQACIGFKTPKTFDEVKQALELKRTLSFQRIWKLQ